MSTLVTSLLQGGKVANRFNDYIESLSKIIKTNIPIVLFVDSKTKHLFVPNENLKIYDFDLSLEFPYLDLVSNLITHSSFLDSADWVRGSSQAKYPTHNHIIMSKPYMVRKAIKLNPFNSEKFVWYDAGILKNRPDFGMGELEFKKEELTYLFNLFTKKDLYFMSTSYPPKSPEIHGFRREGILKVLKEFPNYVCRGGNFGGGSKPLIEFTKKYDKLLKNTLEMGYMGTEETIFTLLHSQEPQLYKNYLFNSYNEIYNSIYNQSI